VIIKQRAFDPDIITISPGTTVIWTNEDPMMHRVVHLPGPNSPELFHSDPLSTGQSFSYTFQNSGSYNYGDPQLGSGRTPKVIVS
jgi:plastocyanin